MWRAGKGRSLLLLHGWPEFWYTWQPVITRPTDRFKLIAPDFRGFGDSDKPAGDFDPEEQASDIAELIKALDVGPIGIVSHDVGASVAQVLARCNPEQVAGLFFFNFFYPGIDACETVAVLNAVFPAPKQRERPLSAFHVQERSEFRRSIRP